MSIYSIDEHYDVIVICQNTMIRPNFSYIITKYRQLIRSWYVKGQIEGGDIWADEEGYNHLRKMSSHSKNSTGIEKNFIEIIDNGRYGIVFRAKIDGHQRAVKKVEHETMIRIKSLEDKNNELNIWKKLCEQEDSDKYIVKLIGYEIDEKRDPKFVFIIMELCDINLKKVLDIIKSLNNIYQTEDIWSNFLNYMFFELSKELFECVNYLHTRQPPVLHRDLKPANILTVKEFPENSPCRRNLKLCDFWYFHIT